LGGGAYKLAKYIDRNVADKKLITIDVFDPEFDSTMNTSGDRMCLLYNNALEVYYGKTQLEIFHSVIKGCSNIIVLKVDSKNAVIPAGKICFGFIDGNHDPEYVRHDFHLIWPKLSSGGCLAIHDYGGDLPQTTAAIDELLEMYAGQIFEMDHLKSKDILFVRKK
jgi:Methyltransferase domain